MHRRLVLPGFVFALAGTVPAAAQFVGPSQRGNPATAAAIADLRLGSYVVLTGHIVAHLRSDYFTFQDDTGTARVEIPPELWANRRVTPETRVRILGEVDRGRAGRYVWVKMLDLLP
jgi:uncharacterized protein (TIGR00156 family)